MLLKELEVADIFEGLLPAKLFIDLWAGNHLHDIVMWFVPDLIDFPYKKSTSYSLPTV